MANPGSRAGLPSNNRAGRPKGIKEKTPRLKRTDVLNANREDWARWSRNDGLLRKARKRLGEIIADKESNDKDAINAAKLLLEYDVGRPTEAKDQPTPQPLTIYLSTADGGYQQLSQGRKPIEIEVTDSTD